VWRERHLRVGGSFVVGELDFAGTVQKFYDRGTVYIFILTVGTNSRGDGARWLAYDGCRSLNAPRTAVRSALPSTIPDGFQLRRGARSGEIQCSLRIPMPLSVQAKLM